MRFEYPINSKYIRDWGPLHALREFGANAFDAETMHGARATITYSATKRVLTFRNEGVTLDRSALILGGTDKDDRSDTVGTYGEGMKMGFLVCARENIPVVVKNGRKEKWVPKMDYSEKWESKVLVLDVTGIDRQVENFEIEVYGIEPETWQALQAMFMKLNPPDQTVTLTGGEILMDAEFVGRIYCRGVYVTYKSDFYYGYNFSKLELNRDRKFTESIDEAIGDLWKELVQDRPDKRAELYKLLNDDKPEGQAVKYYAGATLARSLADEFKARHGEGVFIAKSTEEAARFEHFGERAVVVSPSLYYVLSSVMETFNSYKEHHKNDVSRTYSLAELDPAERSVYDRAVSLLRKINVIPPDNTRLSIVDFVDPKIRGLHQGDSIKLARKRLGSFGHTVSTLAHEYAHDKGQDGEKDHVETMQETLARAIDALAG